MNQTLFILLTVALVVLNGFFVAAEFALVKVRRSRIEQMAKDGRLFSVPALWLVDRLDNSLSVCQIGITLASLGLGWVGEPAIARLLEPALHAVGITSDVFVHTVSFIVAFSFITAAHLLIGEQVPKILAIRRPEPLSLWCALPLKLFYVLFYPFMLALSAGTSRLLRLFGVAGGAEHGGIHSADELRSLISDSHVHGSLSRAKHRLIDAAFEFDETIARQVMVPRMDVAFFDAQKGLPQAFNTAKATLHTRYPVCEGSLDHVIGVVHIKDLLGVGSDDDVDLRSIMRPPRFVPETTRISKLLGHFQATKQHLAFVVDEYGTLAGLVTLENVLEQIVGAVQDEFDVETPNIVPDGPGQYLVQGGTSLELLAQKLDLDWTSREVSTISGYITEKLGHVPGAGDRLELEGAKVEVVSVGNSRATSIRLILPAHDDASGER